MSTVTDLARSIIETARQAGIKIATAESCTGGMVSAALTDIAGSSAVFDRGFITYSNDAKHHMLGVEERLIAEHGAVSEPVARAMAEGAIQYSKSDISIAITGIAGPCGGSPTKPVGLVHFACALKNKGTRHYVEEFGDLGRNGVRNKALLKALDIVRERLNDCD